MSVGVPTFLVEGLGLCRTEGDPDWWTTGKRIERNQAIRVCRRCPFREECLGWALRTGAKGVYGATTTSHRTERKKSARAAIAV